MIQKILLSIALFCASLSLSAQRFGMALQAGPSLSQIDGDFTKGFDKIGYSAGIEGQIYFTKRFYTSLGIQYTSKGSKRKTESLSPSENFNITLNYIEVPLCFHFRTKRVGTRKRDTHFKYDLYAGAAFGRLMNSTLQDGIKTIDYAFSFIENQEISAILGLRYRLSPHIALGGEFMRSLNKIYDYEALPNAVIRKHWYSRSVNLKLFYTL